ncbi:MAG: hypothetical protein ABEJ03_00465 [Candidatus Nanohaloarchaea archaeon]
MSQKVQVQNENLDNEDFLEAEGADEPFEMLLEEEGVDDVDELSEPKEVSTSELSEGISDVLVYEDSNVLELRNGQDSSYFHIGGLSGTDELIMTAQNDQCRRRSPDDDRWPPHNNLEKIAYNGLDIADDVIKPKDNMVFSLPVHLEIIDNSSNSLYPGYNSELNHLSQCGAQNKNDKGFLASEGNALAQVESGEEKYALLGEFNQDQDTYTVEESVELDYDIDIQMANRNLPLGESGLDDGEKERVFEGLTEIASDVEPDDEKDWELGVYETDEQEALIYLEDHIEENVEVLGYEKAESSEDIYDLEALDETSYGPISARKGIYENRGLGNKTGINNPLEDLAVNPSDARGAPDNGEFGGNKVVLKDFSECDAIRRKKYKPKDNEVWAGYGGQARIGGYVE